MADGDAGESKILATYLARTRRAAELNRSAREVLPGGIVHDSRRMSPYGIYGDRALGSRKWDVDGNEYVDYYGGHGSLLLGHQHPEGAEGDPGRSSARACTSPRRTSSRSSGRALIQEMVPSVERVRFTSSGTEATQLAMRLARAHDGQAQDRALPDAFPRLARPGRVRRARPPRRLAERRRAARGRGQHDAPPPNDVADVERVIAERKDVAAVMIEPVGSSSGIIPTPPEVLGALREITKKHGVLLIFDEVVTGFRVAPGGAQAYYGVMPDLTTMAKIVAGGMPGGAVGGPEDILDWLDYEACSGGRARVHQPSRHAQRAPGQRGGGHRDAEDRSRLRRVRESVGDGGDAAQGHERSAGGGGRAVGGLRRAFVLQHPFESAAAMRSGRRRSTRARSRVESLKGRNESMLGKLRLAMLKNGVDLKGWRGGILSAAHTQADVDFTLDAWRKSLRALKEEGALK